MKKLILPPFIALFILFISFTSCTSEEDEVAILEEATITLNISDNVDATYTTIRVSGEIATNVNTNTLTYGLVWSTNPTPTISDNATVETSSTFTSEITDLTVNTTYYFRTYATSSTGTTYSTEQTFSTLSLDNTSWKFTTIFPGQTDFELYSKVDLFDDNTTLYDEMDFPFHCPGCFITEGTWSVDGNTLTYIWEGSDADNSTYVYTGTISGMEITGTYTHTSTAGGNWSAILL